MGGIWFISTQLNIQEIRVALQKVSPFYIFASLLAFLLTTLLKILRWRMMYSDEKSKRPFAPFFWSFMLGLYVNAIMPLLRLGEIGRAIALYNKTGISKARTLTTLIIEKLLEIIILGVTLLLLLSTTLVSTLFQDSTTPIIIAAIALIAFLILILIAIYTEWVKTQLEGIIARLPSRFRRPLNQLIIAGLEGLAAFRQGRQTVLVVGTSALIGIISILTPYYLFLAFNLPFGLVEATIIHVAVSIALVPPSTPAKIGVFDGVVAFLLFQFGLQDEAALFSYTIIFHLVLFLPQIVLGGIASWQSDWRWQSAKNNF